MRKSLTKAQMNKVERLGKEIYSIWTEINKNASDYSYKEITEMELLLAKKENELQSYCIKVNISEEEFYSIQIIADILDGVEFQIYMSN